MPLDRTSARRCSSRRWYRPAAEPLPAEPGRLVVNALLGRARRERGCTTPGDDRLETRAYAVKRYLFRLGHAQRTGRYATSIAQLVVGLAPVIGWGPVPSGAAARARFVCAHRRSVQRWLDDLSMAGLVAHEPERDADGKWWRTQIVLLAAPAPSRDELAAAKRRARSWRWRESARRRRERVAPSLDGIRARSATPGARRGARIAFVRCAGRHEAGRRATVEAQIAVAIAARAVPRDLTHPYGAPPTSALAPRATKPPESSETAQVEGQRAQQAVRAVPDDGIDVGETGARGRAAGGQPPGAAQSRTACTEEAVVLSLEAFNALVAERVAARERAWAWRSALLRSQASDRVAEVFAWPAGRRCPLGRLREAWVARRYGLAMVVESGTAAAGRSGPGLAPRVGRAITLYEAFAAERPPGWPASGPAALLALASLGAAERFAGDVARLLLLAKGMRAAALERDATRIDRARRRAEARRARRRGRFVFRTISPRGELAEQRRVRVRDDVLLDGGNPAAWPNAALALAHHPTLQAASAVALLEPDPCEELDGVGGRAARYRAELARGRWQLPHDLPTNVTDPQGGNTHDR